MFISSMTTFWESYDYALALKEVKEVSMRFSDEEIQSYKMVQPVSTGRMVFQSGITQNYKLAVSMVVKAKYYISANYMSQGRCGH